MYVPGTTFGPLGVRYSDSSSTPGPPELLQVRFQTKRCIPGVVWRTSGLGNQRSAMGSGGCFSGCLIFRGESAHEFLLRIENLQRDIAGCRLEEIINHGAGGRVLGGWFLRRKRRAREGVVIDAKCWRGMVKPECIRLCGLGSLAQRSDVVQNPEGAAVRGNDRDPRRES